MAGKMCHDPTGYIQINNVLQGAFGVFSDLYILVIPIPAILKLHLPTQRKLAVLSMFLTGSLWVVFARDYIAPLLISGTQGMRYEHTCSQVPNNHVQKPRQQLRYGRITYGDVSTLHLSKPNNRADKFPSTIEISVGMIIPTFPALAVWVKQTSAPVRHYLSTRYGWGSLGDDGEASGASDESEMAKLRRIILPNGKTYSQSDTIDKMVYGKKGAEFQGMGSTTNSERTCSSSEDGLAAKPQLWVGREDRGRKKSFGNEI
jgi:hypothetical protein